MKQSRIRGVAALLSLGVVNAAQATESTQSLEAIRQAAQLFVRSQIPGEPNTVEVAVGALDSSLRLAACAEPLQAGLAAGATFRKKTVVVVSCRGGTRWTVYVPVLIEMNVSTLILRHAALRGAALGYQI
jgi:flagella basal body P-ring formation protein FlgA